jgi:EpsI family protein
MPRSVYACAALVGVVAVCHHAIWLFGRAGSAARPTPLAAPLEEFPAKLDGWVGEDIRLPDAIVENAGADTYLRRDYVSPGGGRVSLYVAFYGNVLDSIPHGPVICYPSAGWATARDEVTTFDTKVPGLETLRVQKLLYEKDFSRVAVLYWYSVNGEQMAETQRVRYDAARRKLLGLGGAYVLQVMVSTPVAVSGEAAFGLLESFLGRSFPQVARHLPRPADSTKGGERAAAE